MFTLVVLTCSWLEGHTLRLLNLPDFAGASLSKFIRLRKSLKGAAGIIKGIFGDPDEEDQVWTFFSHA